MYFDVVPGNGPLIASAIVSAIEGVIPITAEAGDWVGLQIETYANDAVTDIAERWANSDPQAVIEWASQLPESAQAGAYMEALDEWTEREATCRWHSEH